MEWFNIPVKISLEDNEYLDNLEAISMKYITNIASSEWTIYHKILEDSFSLPGNLLFISSVSPI